MIDFILRPIRRRFGKDRKFYAAIDDMFGFIPHNIELYKLALIHKSASVTLDDGRQINNERLEFLGDAVIESVTSDYLFIEFPDQNEGFLTQLRSKMVSRQSLNEVAKRLKLDTHVITHSSASFSQKHIYGDAFEAMMGAIYLDQGYDFVNRLLINRIFGDYLRTGALLEEETDFKSRLIEWCQKNHHTIRFITSHDRSYSSSHPVFICKVLIDDIEAGYGSGDSKKEAEQHAAFSVSQGFREEDCAKLFDRLDAIERGLTPSRPQRRQNDQNDQNNDIPGTSEPQSRKAEKDTTAENRKAGGEKQERSEQNPDAENTDNTDSESGAAKSTGRSHSSRRARRRAAAAAADNVTDTVTEEQTANADEGVTANIDANAPETISDQAAEDSTSATDAESVSTPDNVLSDTDKADSRDAEPILTATDPAAEQPSENIPAENTQTEHQEAETATEENVQSELSVDTSTASEQKGAGRSRSRRSRRKTAAQATEPEATQQDSTTEKAEPSAESDNADTASEQAAEKTATSKRRSRRRPKAAVTEAEIFEVSAMEITEPAPETAPSENSETAAESVAEAKEAATPKRRPRRRQPKSAKASSEKNSGNTAENTTEGVASAEDGNGGMTEEAHTESDNTNAAQQAE